MCEDFNGRKQKAQKLINEIEFCLKRMHEQRSPDFNVIYDCFTHKIKTLETFTFLPNSAIQHVQNINNQGKKLNCLKRISDLEISTNKFLTISKTNNQYYKMMIEYEVLLNFSNSLIDMQDMTEEQLKKIGCLQNDAKLMFTSWKERLNLFL